MRPLGLYIARVVEGESTFLDPVLRPVERLLYRACGVQADQEMSWQQYTIAMLIFSLVSLLLTYLIERAQSVLPWNPQHLAGVAPATAFNTAVSFTTNANWQVYTPETAMSYFSQMVGLVFVVLSVFIAGLMVGRTPEYLGKKIESYDIKMAMLYVLIFPLLILVLSAVSVLHPAALASLGNNGPHGLSEILYAYVSTAGNNGCAKLRARPRQFALRVRVKMRSGNRFQVLPCAPATSSTSKPVSTSRAMVK